MSTFYSFITVVSGKGFIHHCPITLNQLTRRPVFEQELFKVSPSFFTHRVLEVGTEFVARHTKAIIYQRDGLFHFQPLRDKRANESIKTPFIFQQAPCLCTNHLVITNLT